MASDLTTLLLTLAIVPAGIGGYLLWLRNLARDLRERAERLRRG